MPFKFFRFKQKPRLFLSFLKPKPVSREKLNAFWERCAANAQIGKQISEASEQKVVPITRSVLGTVRIFDSGKSAREYVKRTRNFVSQINSEKPERFAVMPVQILDIRDNRVLERVYLAPSLRTISSDFRNRYTKLFFSRMRAKGANLEEARNDIGSAYLEFIKIEGKRNLNFDSAEGNILVLDYDPKSRRCLFGLVDAFE
ncbi:MAG: hypothetical protein WC602_04720 [archaeon]